MRNPTAVLWLRCDATFAAQAVWRLMTALWVRRISIHDTTWEEEQEEEARFSFRKRHDVRLKKIRKPASKLPARPT
jgi:hypothetical protein